MRNLYTYKCTHTFISLTGADGSAYFKIESWRLIYIYIFKGHVDKYRITIHIYFCVATVLLLFFLPIRVCVINKPIVKADKSPPPAQRGECDSH